MQGVTITALSSSSGGVFQLTSVPVLSGVVVFLRSVVLLTPNGQVLGCANIALGL